MRTPRFASSLFVSLLLATALQAQAQAVKAPVATSAPAIKLVKPESVGFSSEGLKKMDPGMQAILDKGHLSGVVTLVARHGEVVQYKAYGYQDIASKKPMKVDSIFRIYSMTKPITGVAMMMLYEEGKWKPSDPIAKQIPEFANLKVYAGEKDGKPVFVEPNHQPTMAELMSHSAGFTYGLFGASAVDKMYQAANPLGQPSLKAMIDTLAKLPLAYQPGERWMYSVSVDIQGYLVEKLSGKSFPDFLRERIFEPLAMKDTAFYVPQEKLSRVATIYAWDAAKGALAGQPEDPAVITKVPGLPSGGGGLFGTAADYFRFAQMLLNGGELDGTRLLKASSVAIMRTNVLSEQALNSKSSIGQAVISPAQGFGFDFAVVNDPEGAKRRVGKNSYWWWGIAGTWFWIDPTNDVVFVGMIQRRGGAPGAVNHEDVSRNVVYDSLVNPER